MKDNFSNYHHPQLSQSLNRGLVNIADKSLTVVSPRSTVYLIDSQTLFPLVSGGNADKQISSKAVLYFDLKESQSTFEVIFYD